MMSSASDALLILLCGLLTVAGGGIIPLEDLDIGGVVPKPALRPRGVDPIATGVEMGGNIAPGDGGTNVPLPGRDGGIPNVLDGRDGGPVDLGGGGVEVVGVAAAAPPFLLTHFFRFSSYTKEFSSPSLALIGPF